MIINDHKLGNSLPIYKSLFYYPINVSISIFRYIVGILCVYIITLLVPLLDIHGKRITMVG